jgi:hypothetical protein
MKSIFTPALVFMFLIAGMTAFAQDEQTSDTDEKDSEEDYKLFERRRREKKQRDYHINTIFNNHGPRSSGGYVAMSNKFTTINGDFANMVELYAGWYINHSFLIGIGTAATTNHLPVQLQHSTAPTVRMSYEYGQAGLMTEYVIASDKVIHLSVQAFGGAGFTLQYPRDRWDDDQYWDTINDYDHDENWFWVAEPGVKVEVNVFRWFRICPGVSYRKAFGSDGRGLRDENIDGASFNMTLKLGRF